MALGINAYQAEQIMRQAFAALDTAHGCLELVAVDCKPIDLDECRQEIDAARNELVAVLDATEPKTNQREASQ